VIGALARRLPPRPPGHLRNWPVVPALVRLGVATPAGARRWPQPSGRPARVLPRPVRCSTCPQG